MMHAQRDERHKVVAELHVLHLHITEFKEAAVKNEPWNESSEKNPGKEGPGKKSPEKRSFGKKVPVKKGLLEKESPEKKSLEKKSGKKVPEKKIPGKKGREFPAVWLCGIVGQTLNIFLWVRGYRVIDKNWTFFQLPSVDFPDIYLKKNAVSETFLQGTFFHGDFFAGDLFFGNCFFAYRWKFSTQCWNN